MLKKYFLLIIFIAPLLCIKGYISYIDINGSIQKNIEINYIESTNKNIFVRTNKGFLNKSSSINIPCEKLLSVNVQILGRPIKTNCPNNCISGDCISGYGEFEYSNKGIYKGLFNNGKPYELNNFFPYNGWKYENYKFTKIDKSFNIITWDIILTITLFALIGIIMVKIKRKYN